MNKLKDNMMVGKDEYSLIKRTERVVLYSVNEGRRFDVYQITIAPKLYDPYWWYHYPEREVISSDRRDGFRYFFKLEDAEQYYDQLNQKLQVDGKQ